MFGNLGNSWTAGFSHFSELSETFSKLKQDVEQNIENSLRNEGKAAGPRSSLPDTSVDLFDEGARSETGEEEAERIQAASSQAVDTPEPTPHDLSAADLHATTLPASGQDAQQQQDEQSAEPPDLAASSPAVVLDADSGWEAATLSPLSTDELLSEQQDVQQILPAPTDQTSTQQILHSDAHSQDAMLTAVTEESEAAEPEAQHEASEAAKDSQILNSVGADQPSVSNDHSQLADTPQQLPSSPTVKLSAPARPQEPEPDALTSALLPRPEVNHASAAASDPQEDERPQQQLLEHEASPSGQQQQQQRGEDMPAMAENGDAAEETGDQAQSSRADGPRSFAEAGRDLSKASLAESSASTSERLHGPDVSSALPQENGDLPHDHAAGSVPSDLNPEVLPKLVRQLRQTVSAREAQLEGQAKEQSRLEDVTHQLMARNEELARRTAAISEQDFESMRSEFQARLEAAERKVYALTKERDALRRGTDKLSSANDLLKEKDSIIQQVMEEGERLSKKQLAQESSIKKLRAQLKELELAKAELATGVTIERNKVEAAQAGQLKAESEAKDAAQAHKAELEAEKAHFTGMLQKARAAQAEAEQRAAASAKEGLQKKLKDAEARVESLAETVEELRSGLARQQAAADLRADMHTREVSDLGRRNQAAEARHEELAAALPEATRPLVRQLEAMQAAAQQQHAAWAAAEASLTSRAHDAEARAAAAAERERSATDRLQAANARAASSAASTEALRSEISSLTDDLHQAMAARKAAETALHKADSALAQARAEAAEVERAAGEAARLAESDWQRERAALQDSHLVAEQRAGAAEDRLKSGLNAGSSRGSDGVTGNAGSAPPAMAGPGYRWVLQKEGESDPQPGSPSSQASGHSSHHILGPGTGAGSVPYAQHRGRPVQGSAGELDRLRDHVRQREDQIASMQGQISGLESTRDSLAEELVRASQAAEAGHAVQRQMDRLHAEHAEVKARLAAAEELLGEREERLAELSADLADVKLLYKDQIEFMVEQLTIAKTPPASPALHLPQHLPHPESERTHDSQDERTFG